MEVVVQHPVRLGPLVPTVDHAPSHAVHIVELWNIQVGVEANLAEVLPEWVRVLKGLIVIFFKVIKSWVDVELLVKVVL